jgi:GT2 family glycosyltransferase
MGRLLQDIVQGEKLLDQPLTIVIVAWNTRELLRRCLQSLENVSVELRSQVIVVDNASSDGTVEMVRDGFPWVELIASDRNLGFGAANNLAFSRAKGEHVLLLNPDTEVRAGAIETVVEYLRSHPDVGAVGTTLLNPDGTLQPSCHSFYSFFDSLKHNRLMERVTDRWKVSAAQRGAHPSDVDWMIGACLLVRGETLRAMNGFDPAFFLYAEEIDLEYRIRKAGLRVVFVPSPGVVHYGGQSARQAPVAAAFHDYRGRWLFIRKHYSTAAATAYLAKTVVAIGFWLSYWGFRALTGTHRDAGHQLSAYWQLLIWHLSDRGQPPVPRWVRQSEEMTPSAL